MIRAKPGRRSHTWRSTLLQHAGERRDQPTGVIRLAVARQHLFSRRAPHGNAAIGIVAQLDDARPASPPRPRAFTTWPSTASSTMSGAPLFSLAITGRPEAIASSSTNPMASFTDGNTNTSAARYRAGSSSGLHSSAQARLRPYQTAQHRLDLGQHRADQGQLDVTQPLHRLQEIGKSPSTAPAARRRAVAAALRAAARQPA